MAVQQYDQPTSLGKRKRAECRRADSGSPNPLRYATHKPPLIDIPRHESHHNVNQLSVLPIDYSHLEGRHSINQQQENLRPTSKTETSTSPPLKHRRTLPVRSPKLARKSTKSSLSPPHWMLLLDSNTKASLLAPCHVCHKAPLLKTSLDAYTSCWRCSERTCYVCLRQCQALTCGERMICSSCCVEVGEEGDAFCLDCLACLQDQEMEG